MAQLVCPQKGGTRVTEPSKTSVLTYSITNSSIKLSLLRSRNSFSTLVAYPGDVEGRGENKKYPGPIFELQNVSGRHWSFPIPIINVALLNVYDVEEALAFCPVHPNSS